MRAVRAVGSAGAALCAAALLAALAAAPAGAAPATIASYGSGPGEVWNPVGVALDATGAGAEAGTLYVADRNNHRIDAFGPGGDFLLAWGWGVADGASQELQVCGPGAAEPTRRCFKASSTTASGPGAVAPEAVAVEPSSGDVYVADASNRRIAKFGPDGEFLFMVGKGVDQGGGSPAHPGNICTAGYLEDGDDCGRGESGTGPGEFTAPQSLAFDPSGNLWVGDTDRLVELRADGTPGEAGEVALPGAGQTRSLATDSAGDFYLVSAALPGVRKLEPDGAPYPAPYPLDEAGNPRAVTVDGEDRVYLGDCGASTPTCPGYRFMVYDPGGVQTAQFGAGQVIGAPGGELGSNALALDAGAGGGKRLYVAAPTVSDIDNAVQAFAVPQPGPLPEDQRVKEGTPLPGAWLAPLPTAATLQASLNPENEATDYRFEYDTAPYAEGEGEGEHGAAVGEGSLPAGFEDVGVEAQLEGLLPDTTYHFRLCATNATASVCGPDTELQTRTAIGIEAQWVAALAARDAALRATLDPLGATDVTWWVQYGSGGALDRETEHRPLAGESPLTVSAPLAGLDPASGYSYRFVAHATQDGHPYTTYGETHAFTTQPAGLGASLPDSRAWEMVTPPDKHGAAITAYSQGTVQAAAGGEALAYLSRGSVQASPEGNSSPRLSSTLARRGEGGRWQSRDLTPPHTATGFGTPEYKLFSSELGRALLEPVRLPAALPGGERTHPLPARERRAPHLHPTGQPGERAGGEWVRRRGARGRGERRLLPRGAPVLRAARRRRQRGGAV